MCPLDTIADCVQLLRALVELKIEPPMWRRGRPQLLIEGAAFEPHSDASFGTLRIDAYVRHVGLCANQLVAVPGGEDHQIESISAAQELVPLPGQRPRVDAGAADAVLAAADKPWCDACARGRAPEGADAVYVQPRAACACAVDHTGKKGASNTSIVQRRR
jgi:AARP2CN (NUC121) domain